jgi:hypothetical protein
LAGPAVIVTVAGLLLSETVCFDRWKARLPLAHCLASSWQQRC